MAAVSCLLFATYNQKLPYLIDQAELSHGASRVLRFRVTLVIKYYPRDSLRLWGSCTANIYYSLVKAPCLSAVDLNRLDALAHYNAVQHLTPPLPLLQDL